jgi:hypothetical protein
MTPPTPVDPPDRDRIVRAAENLKLLLRELLDRTREAVAATNQNRQLVRDDLEEVLKRVDGETVLNNLVIEIQRKFDDDHGSTEVQVEISEGCAGEEDAGVMATEGDITVKACATGPFTQAWPPGGGLDMLFRYMG